jgi:integrase
VTLEQLFKARYLPHVKRHLKPKTVAEYERLAQAEILPMLGGRALESLTLDDAEALHAAVPGKVQANRAVSLLSGMLTFAVRRRLLAVHPCRGVERNPERGREFFYDPAATRAILAAASGWGDIRAKYIALELLTGCRPGELLDSGPHWRHGAVLRTPDGKTGGRTIFLPPAACAILDGLEPCRRYFPAGMDLRRAWITLCRLAGVPRARLYDLRHTFASAALAAGQSLAIVGEMLGHRKAQTTKRYVHLAPDVGLKGAAAAAERMGA